MRLGKILTTITTTITVVGDFVTVIRYRAVRYRYRYRIVIVRTVIVRYGDSAGNTVEENSSVFSLIRMRWLLSVL